MNVENMIRSRNHFRFLVASLFLFQASSAFSQEYDECGSGGDEYCISLCEGTVDWLGQPHQIPWQFLGSECLGVGDTCACYTKLVDQQDHGGFMRLEITGDENNCLRYGRACQCIFYERDFQGCNIEEKDTSCIGSCSELEKRVIEDYNAIYDTTMHGAFCDDNNLCQCVINYHQQCYLFESDNGCIIKPYDCSKSPEDIWREHYCSIQKCNGGGGPSCGCDLSGSSENVLSWLCLFVFFVVRIQRRKTYLDRIASKS